MKKDLLFIFLAVCWAASIYAHPPLTFHIFSERNGKGLEADMNILKDALEGLGQKVETFDALQCPDLLPFADINIYFQSITIKALPFARWNWFIPNPEFYTENPGTMEAIDLILCRTKEVERIFQEQNLPTYFLGFTSEDHFQPGVDKDFHLYLHVAGSSGLKGTRAIRKAWMRNPHFPSLTIIQHGSHCSSTQTNLAIIPYRISPKSLLYLQNRCGVHLCMSETEGFGHYLLEAMSTGAVVITTNAPPMNEFVIDSRCLVAYHHTSPLGLATTYHVNETCFANQIRDFQNLSWEKLQEIGRNNRLFFLANKQEFSSRLKHLIDILELDIP